MKLAWYYFFIALLFVSACDQKTTEKFYTTYDSLTYDIHMGERLAGKQISWRDTAGNYRYVYEYNDRGRGPYYEETIRLNDNGVIAYQSVMGHNYLKDTVAEVFEVKENMASWTSAAEKGNKEFTGNEEYSNLDGSYGALELLTKKLLSTPDQSMDLLPSGKAQISDTQNISFSDSLNLKLISITGFGFTPLNIWLDEQDRFFATVSPGGFNCIRTGYDNLVPEMEALIKTTEDSFFSDMARNLTQAADSGIAITHVALFDSKTKSLKPDMTVVVKGNKIKAVQNSDENLPEGLHMIDGSGKTLLPGLFDMHVHISKDDGILQLAAGVTSVRDMANSLELSELKENFDKNNFIGPRIPIMCGIVDGTGKYAAPTNMLINNVEEGYACIQKYKDLGYQQIKLYSSIKPEWVQSLTAKAHELGMKVSGHVPAHMSAEQAIQSGYNEIQHINMLFLNFLSDTLDTRTPLRFTMVAQHAEEVDINSQKFKNFIALLKKNNIVIDPTVSIFEGMFKGKKGEPDPAYAMITDRLPVNVRRNYYTGGLPVPEGFEQKYPMAHDKMLVVTKALYDNGITIVPGTDALPGFTLHRELENYVKAGIPAAEVLVMATLTSAKVCKAADQVGSIEAGKLADMILVNGNPVENISDIRKVDLTIKNGKIYDTSQLYEAVGVSPYQQ